MESEARKAYRKKYIEDHREELREYSIQYYDNNKEKIKAKMRVYNIKITCECGRILTKKYLKNHRKTKAHQKIMDEKEELA